jgi:hypothetical protein
LSDISTQVKELDAIEMNDSLSDFNVDDNTSLFGMPSRTDIETYYAGLRDKAESQNKELRQKFDELFRRKQESPYLTKEQITVIDTQMKEIEDHIAYNNALIEGSFKKSGEVIGEVMQRISDGLMQIADGASSLVSGIFDMVNSQMEYEVEKLNEIA